MVDLFNGVFPKSLERKPVDLFNGVYPESLERDIPKLEQAEERGFFARMYDRVTRDPEAERAKAANVMALAKVNKVSPAEAENRYGELTDEIRDQPSVGSVGRKVARVAKHVAKHPKETAVGVGESVLHVASAVPAFIGSGLAGTRALVSGGDVPKAVGQVAEALTYAPRSDLGKKLAEPFDELMALPHAASGAAGDAVYERTGSPELAATVATVIEGLPVALMAKGPLSSAFKVITESAPFRMLTIPERGLVVQSLEETVRKNPGMTEKDLIQASDYYFKDALAERMKTENPLTPDRTKMVREPAESPGRMTENVMVPGEPDHGPVAGVAGDRVAAPGDVVAPVAASVKRYDVTYNLPQNTVAGGVTEIGELHDAVASGEIKGVKRAVRFGVVDPSVALVIKEKTGFDLDGYKHSIDNSGVLHILKNHGDASFESGRNQVAMTREDFEKIPEIVSTFDDVEYVGKDKSGRDLIRYTKAMDGTVYYVEEIRSKRMELAAKSMWKTRLASDVTAPSEASSSLRPDPFRRDFPQPDENLRPSDDHVKPDVSGGGSKAPSGYASSGTFADIPMVEAPPSNTGGNRPLPAPIEMPELVEFATEISGGKYPQIVRRLTSKAVGMFRPGTGRIDIVAELFGDPVRAAKTVAHEIGHWIDWYKGKTLARGNIFGHLAGLHGYMKHQIEEAPGVGGVHITPKGKAALKDEALRLLQADADAAMDGEITATLPVTPADVLSIFNAMEPLPGVTPALHNYIKGLNTAEKKAIVKSAMKGLVPDELQRFAAEVRASGSGGKIEITDDAIRAKFEALFLRELKKRRLIHLDTVMKELKDFTHKWKPFDAAADPEHTAYRYKPAELYADAFSAFVTNPGFLAQEAPTYYHSFMAYMENKPEVKAVYDEIQGRYAGDRDALLQHRLDREHAGFDEAEAKRKEMANVEPEGESFIETLDRGLIDKNGPAHGKIKRLAKKNPAEAVRANNTRNELEELRHLDSEINVYVKRVKDDVYAPLIVAGIDPRAFGSYVMAFRVLGDRASLANPGGQDPVAAREKIEKLERDWGPEKTQVARDSKDAFRALREKNVLRLASESTMYTEELMEMMETNKDYVKVSVVSKLEKKYGPATTARVFKQFGTFDPNENPIYPTVHQDMSVIRAARLNIAKRNMVDALTALGATDIQDADLRFSKDIEGMVPVEPKDPKTQAIFTVIAYGKAKHYYVDPSIVAMFELHPLEGNAVTRAIRRSVSIPRQLMVSKNAKWMVKNILVDHINTFKNLKEIRIRDYPKFIGLHFEVMREVRDEVYRGIRSPDLEDAYLEKAIPTHRIYSEWDNSVDTAMDKLFKDFSFDPVQSRQVPAMRTAFERFWDWGVVADDFIDKSGRASEMISKLAAYKYLKRYTAVSPGERGHKVRWMAGTPDFKQRGAWASLVNNWFLFSTVNINGLRASVESFKDAPGAYVTKTALLNWIPKLVMAVILNGALYRYLKSKDDRDDENDGVVLRQLKRLQRILSGVPAHDLATTNVIPLWLNKNGESVYLALPQDYEGQFWGALAYKGVIEQKFSGPDGVGSLLYDKIPYTGDFPYLEILGNYTGYYLKDYIPVDEYRGRKIMTQAQADAGGWDALKPILKQNLRDLGFDTIYTMPYDDLEEEDSLYKTVSRVYGINAFTQFIRVSDRGIKEQLDKEIETIRSRKAHESVVRKGVYIRMTNEAGQPITLSLEEMHAMAGQKGSAIRAEMMKLMARKCGSVYAQAFFNANSVEERQAVLNIMVKDGGQISFEKKDSGSPLPVFGGADIPADDGSPEPVDGGGDIRLGGDELWNQ